MYSNAPRVVNDSRIMIRNSLYPDLKIIDFSHTCLGISPKNPLLGMDSHYNDLSHYPSQGQFNARDIYYGAITKANLKNHLVARLSYNPDFDNMLNALDNFLLDVSSS